MVGIRLLRSDTELRLSARGRGPVLSWQFRVRRSCRGECIVSLRSFCGIECVIVGRRGLTGSVRDELSLFTGCFQVLVGHTDVLRVADEAVRPMGRRNEGQLAADRLGAPLSIK